MFQSLFVEAENYTIPRIIRELQSGLHSLRIRRDYTIPKKISKLKLYVLILIFKRQAV